MATKSMKPLCLACVSFDVEAIVDEEPAEIGLFACFECQDVFYFMTDAQPRRRRLGLFELYEPAHPGNREANANRAAFDCS